MPGRRGLRPLKRWSYVGLFDRRLMLAAGQARVGPLPQSFWAVWDRRRQTLDTATRFLRAGSVAAGPASLSFAAGDLRVEAALTPIGQAVEVVSPHGGSYIWTRKVPVRADGHLAVGMEVTPFSLPGLFDLSAGYHARTTRWEWSAGAGISVDGREVVWNLVRGIHDSEALSERTVWVDGVPAEVPPVRFSPDLDEVWGRDGTLLRFSEEARRDRRDGLGPVTSDYVQPFGRFSGTLPGGVELSTSEPAFGVMERHRARW